MPAQLELFMAVKIDIKNCTVFQQVQPRKSTGNDPEHCTDMLPTSYRHLTTHHQLSADCWSSVGQLVVCDLGKTCRLSVGQQLAVCRPDRFFRELFFTITPRTNPAGDQERQAWTVDHWISIPASSSPRCSTMHWFYFFKDLVSSHNWKPFQLFPHP